MRTSSQSYRTNQYLRMNKNQLVWCLRFGGCRSLGEKDSNVLFLRIWMMDCRCTCPKIGAKSRLRTTQFHYIAGTILSKSRIVDVCGLRSRFVIVSTTNLPLFDEEFVDYGYNKIQWISLLRYSGYKFTVLSNSWAFHMRHSPFVFTC